MLVTVYSLPVLFKDNLLEAPILALANENFAHVDGHACPTFGTLKHQADDVVRREASDNPVQRFPFALPFLAYEEGVLKVITLTPTVLTSWVAGPPASVDIASKVPMAG